MKFKICPTNYGKLLIGATSILKMFMIKKASPREMLPWNLMAAVNVAVCRAAGKKYREVILPTLSFHRVASTLSSLIRFSDMSFKNILSHP
jgi:hypothetical protein